MAIKIAGTDVIDNNRYATNIEGVELSAIAKDIEDTAVDVFVYDTRKDSDGGAWRKRCQHTSWYNETLNTATRGSRKEFPAVAVIVAETDTVTIYDGDDPDMPMWMVFNRGTGYQVNPNQYEDISAVSAFNGVIASGTGDRGVRLLNFVKDESSGYRDVLTGTSGIASLPLSGRNTANTFDDSLPVIVNDTVNDVAMTVLPNAPIDDATGLPIPTIAVATDGGVSVIKDDGSVVDYTYAISDGTSRFVTFVDNGIFYLSRNYNNTKQFYGFRYHNIASSDVTGDPDRVYSYQSNSSQMQLTSPINGLTTPLYGLVNSGDDVTIGTSSYSTNLGSGIYKIRDTGTFKEELISHITSSYNTGWMNGDIKLATLSDTDDTDVTGSELVTNGTFDSDLSGWTTGFGGSTGGTIVQSSGAMVITQGTNSVWMGVYQAVDVTGLDKVTISAERTAVSGGGNLRVGLHTSATVTSAPNLGYLQITNLETGVGTKTIDVSGSTTLYLVVAEGSAAGRSSTVDNISVRLAEEDRSVNGNGLQVFGTVTKNPVATGADLVAYSGFSDSNALMQPYNSDLDFGTGAYSVMFWVKKSGTGEGNIYHRSATQDGDGSWNSSGNITMGEFNTAGVIRIGNWETGFQNGHYLDYSTSNVANGAWHMLVFVRTANNKMYLYHNGKLINATEGGATNNPSATNTSANLWLGERPYGSRPLTDGELALFRMSATVPSAEQIAKIYEDEKVLFQENAQATLTGSSDAVTALAYDDDTNILSVGTSGGRSDFSGLRRVNETATAVTTAISASNELIVEQ